MFCSTAKESLSNFIPTLYPKSFIQCKEAVYNDLGLELYTPFDSQLRTYSVPSCFFNSNVSSFGW